MRSANDSRSRTPLCWVIAALVLFASMASADVPVIYHSENDDGVPPVGAVEIQPGVATTLYLYIDGGSDESTSPVCVSGTGDEICSYRLSLTSGNGLSLSAFTPSALVKHHLAGTTLGILGGDPWRGQMGPVKIGELEVQGPTGATLELQASQSVNAASGIDAIPPATVITVPEPSAVLGLVAGAFALAALARRRSRRVMGGAGAIALLSGSLLAAPAADAQTAICGDVVSDDQLDVQDLDALESFLTGDPLAPDLQGDPTALDRCDVAPNGQCDVQDYVRIRRYMLEQLGGLDETCTGALPSSVVLPAPTLDQSSTLSTIRASVALSGTAVFPDVEVRVTGGVGRPSVAPDAAGAWKLEVPLLLGQSNALSIFQDYGDGFASQAVTVTVDQTAPTGPATLEGSILDARTGAPLLQAVDLTVAGATYQTDAFGRFTIPDLPEGLVTVVAEPPGYTTGLSHGYTGAIVRSELKADANHIEVPVEVTPVAAPVTVDSAGGTLTTPGGIELVVPAGSLGSPTDLSLTELRGVAAPGYGGVPLVALPAGPIALDPPATLRIPADPASAGATGDFLIVEDDGVTVSPLAGAAVASGFIELPIDDFDGQAVLYDYASTLVYDRDLEGYPTEPGGVEVLDEPLILTGSCEQDEEKPFILYPRNFFFSPDEQFPNFLLGDLVENPERIKSSAPTQGVGFGTITVPKGTWAVYQVTTSTVLSFETVYQYSLSRPGLPTPVGSLLYYVPIAAVPVLIDSGPLGECQPKSSSAYGDPHLVRFDHIGSSLTTVHGDGRYDFQAAGEFVLFESTEDGVVVQTRFVPFPANANVTITKAAAMDVVGDRVMVDIDGGSLRVRVDGMVSALTVGAPLSLPGGGELERFAPVNTQDELIVRWPDGTTVLISLSAFLGSEYLNLYPALAAGRFGKVQGLLGNANGILSDDFALRDGTPAFPVDLYTNYTTSWRISQAESLFDYETGENTSTWDGTPPLPDYGLDDLDPADRAAAEATCVAAGIDEDPLLSECALDVALLGGAATGGALDTLDQVPDVGTYVAVSGQASIFQAGQGSPLDFAGGGGSGLLPTELPLPAGTNRSMRVLDSAGNVAFSSTGSGLSPDGTGFGQIEWGSWGSVAGPRLRRMGQAMGVFLAAGLPSPIPASFDCGAFDGAFATPAIGQVFCIGDGLSFANEPQTFLVPDAATRLFVGHAERLSSQVVEAPVHHLGDNYGTAGLFALAPNPEGVSFLSNPFDLPTSFTPSSGRVKVDLAETSIGGNSVWVNGQFISYLPITGASGTTWLEDVAFTIDPSILTPTGNWIEMRSSGVNLDDYLFRNLRFEVAPPLAVLPEPSDPTPYHLGCNCGQVIGDGVGSGNWGLFALMPTPYGTSWTSPPFDVASPETLGGTSVVIDIAQTDAGNNLVLVNGTVVGTLPIRPDGTVWSTDEEVSFDPALLEETGNRIEVRSGYLVPGFVEVDDFMMRNARLAVAAEAAVPPGGYSDNSGVHEFIIDVSP